jgi:hypothetical protein
MTKSEIWKDFVDALSTAVDKRNEYKRKKEEHNAGGSYCPFSDTWEGSTLSKESDEAEASARKYLDMYINSTSSTNTDDL